MRIIQVTIPEGKRQTVIDLLDEINIDYVVSDETSVESRTRSSIFRHRPAPSRRYSTPSIRRESSSEVCQLAAQSTGLTRSKLSSSRSVVRRERTTPS